MANVLRQSLLCASKALLKNTGVTLFAGPRLISAPKIATRGLTLTRNFWCVSSANRTGSGIIQTQEVNKLCGCSRIHTKGDEELVKFLGEEITNERKEDVKKVTKIEGWSPAVDGTNVTLKKQFNNETVTIEFDVNNSLDMDEPEPEAEQDTEPSSMTSRPSFLVKITKSSGKSLLLMCEMTQVYDDVEQPEDLYSIVEFSVDHGDGEETDTGYSLSGSMMDGVMYDLLMDMLFERGVDDDFINNLVDYSTHHEREQYINLLEELKTFMSEK